MDGMRWMVPGTHGIKFGICLYFPMNLSPWWLVTVVVVYSLVTLRQTDRGDGGDSRIGTGAKLHVYL